MTASPVPVLLTRHGTAEHNLVTHVFMGRSPESQLVERGRTQARTLGAHLAGLGGRIDRIVASSLPRSLETARIVAAELARARGCAPPLHGDDRLWELSKGEWEGRMPREDMPEAERARYEAEPWTFRFPGGESLADVAERVVPAFERWCAAHPGDRLLFVLHGDVICALLQRLVGGDPGRVRSLLVRPCSLTELVREDGGWRMLRFSDVAFLKSEQADLSRHGRDR